MSLFAASVDVNAYRHGRDLRPVHPAAFRSRDGSLGEPEKALDVTAPQVRHLKETVEKPLEPVTSVRDQARGRVASKRLGGQRRKRGLAPTSKRDERVAECNKLRIAPADEE